MTGKMVLTFGLPGSGKTTEALKMVNEDPQNIIRANRDDLRTILAPEGEKYHSGTPRKDVENNVTHVQHEIIRKGLREGKTVIVDDTNLNPGRLKPLIQLARNYKSEIEQVHVDTPLEECIRRNNKRGDDGGRRVPEEIIRGMAKRAYGEDGHLKRFIIADNGLVSTVQRTTDGSRKVDEFNQKISQDNPAKGKSVVFLDMDGSLFNNDHHAQEFFKEGEKPNYESFYKSIVSAPVNTKVRDMVNSMYDNDDLTVVAVTGRTDDHAEYLVEALSKSGVKISQLYMKQKGDGRPSSEHKREILHKLQKDGMIVAHAIEDREKDIKMFQTEGVMVSIVEKPVVEPDGTISEPNINTVYGSGHCIRCGSKLKNGGNIGRICATKAKL